MLRQKKLINVPRIWALGLVGLAMVVALRGLAQVTQRTEAQTEGPAAVEKGKAAMEITHAHTNRLIHETSPYLLQHAHNPVDWYSWSDEAFAKAVSEDKPIFLSIGYSTCHWCHVMEHESFENEEIAAVMNEHFVCIKVDREQRPDVDALYMDAIHMMGLQGGWPLSAFLTPEGTPFYGGTYFPPDDRFGRPGFKRVLNDINDKWRNSRSELLGPAEKIKQMLSATSEDQAGKVTEELIIAAAESLERSFDPTHGGFGRAPKFPQPSNMALSLRYWRRSGSEKHLQMVLYTLKAMANGGIYDHLGGGFHRYSTDAKWLVPHFEKMLYDQALIAQVCLDSYLITGEEEYARIVRETMDYVLRDMTDPQGGFYSAEDADSEGEEGTFYVWTPEQTQAVLGERQAKLFNDYYGVTPQGNFEHNTSILNVTKSLAEVAKKHDLSEAALGEELSQAREKLFQKRAQRIRPHRDDKIIAAWNGLFISAMAKAGASLKEQRYRAAAERAADFVLTEMTPAGRLQRSVAQGKLSGPGFLEDYAFFITGLLDLYQATFEVKWLAQADKLAGQMLALFQDETGGALFMTGVDNEKLLVRNKPDYDGAVPSGNSVAALALLRLNRINGNADYAKIAEQIQTGMSGRMAGSPLGLTQLLCAVDFQLGPSAEITIVGKRGDALTREMLGVLHATYLPNAVVLLKDLDDSENRLASLAPFTDAQIAMDGLTTAYVCENYACKRPVTSVADFRKLISQTD